MPVSSRPLAPAVRKFPMFRHHALCGVSIVAIHLAWIAPVNLAYGQSGQPTALPPVNVDAPRQTQAKPSVQRPRTQSASARRQIRQTAATPASAPVEAANVTPSAALANLYQAPNGQTVTPIDPSQFDNRPAFSVADVLRDSPGVSVKQGNGPRDVGISIRGSNA